MQIQQLSKVADPVTPQLILRTVLRVAVTLTLLFTAYALLPARNDANWVKVLVFAVVMVTIVFLIVHQIRSILGSDHPGLRAAEILATLVGVVLVIFSIVYLSMSHSNAQMFSTPLDHISALYFTVVVFSTVGFGDIVAKTDSARLVVTIQILLDIAFIGLVVRLVTGAVQRRLGGG